MLDRRKEMESKIIKASVTAANLSSQVDSLSNRLQHLKQEIIWLQRMLEELYLQEDD